MKNGEGCDRSDIPALCLVGIFRLLSPQYRVQYTVSFPFGSGSKPQPGWPTRTQRKQQSARESD